MLLENFTIFLRRNFGLDLKRPNNNLTKIFFFQVLYNEHIQMCQCYLIFNNLKIHLEI